MVSCAVLTENAKFFRKTTENYHKTPQITTFLCFLLCLNQPFFVIAFVRAVVPCRFCCHICSFYWWLAGNSGGGLEGFHGCGQGLAGGK